MLAGLTLWPPDFGCSRNPHRPYPTRLIFLVAGGRVVGGGWRFRLGFLVQTTSKCERLSQTGCPVVENLEVQLGRRVLARNRRLAQRPDDRRRVLRMKLIIVADWQRRWVAPVLDRIKFRLLAALLTLAAVAAGLVVAATLVVGIALVAATLVVGAALVAASRTVVLPRLMLRLLLVRVPDRRQGLARLRRRDPRVVLRSRATSRDRAPVQLAAERYRGRRPNSTWAARCSQSPVCPDTTSSTRSSIVPGQISRWQITVLVWPIRHTRSRA